MKGSKHMGDVITSFCPSPSRHFGPPADIEGSRGRDLCTVHSSGQAENR